MGKIVSRRRYHLRRKVSDDADGKMSMTSLSAKSRRPEDVVVEGWLHKKGEHIPTWRPRYFLLFNDGALLGFRAKPEKKPEDEKPYGEPLNDFMIKNAATMTFDKPRANMFMLRCLQWTTVIERTFYANSAEARQQWIEAIESINKKYSGTTTASIQEEPMDTTPPTIDENSEYAGAAHAIIGQPAAPNGELSEDHRASMISIADTCDAAKRDSITIKDFDFIKVLGKGTFGKVIMSRERRTGKLYAIKILKKEVIIAREEVAHTLTENRVLQRCRHPFLTQLVYSFDTPHEILFVMQFANGGELFTHLRKCSIFSEGRARFYAAEIVLALGYLHSLDIVYRDMKLENLLLDKDGHIKIADFGLCKEEIKFGDKTSTFCGTPEYLAPEVLEDNDYGRSVDWWGVGVVMYEMMCGRLPFYSKDHNKLFELIMNGELRFPSKLSPEAKVLLTGLLVKDPHQRLGGGPEDALEICRASFFVSVDWEAMYRKEIEPPYKPNVESETDTSYFDTEFTGMPVQLTPPPARGALATVDEQEEMQANFVQFSFHNTFGVRLHPEDDYD